MSKSFQRTAKSFLILALIAAVSVAVAAGHYALRGGDLRGLTARATHAAGRQAETGTANGARHKSPAPPEDESSPSPEGPPAETRAQNSASGAAVKDTGEIAVFFAPRKSTDPTGIDDAFLDFLDSAKTSIHGAFFELEFPAAAKALIAKQQAGLEVEIVSDSDYADREAIQSCIRAGIPVVFDDRKPFMHDKFCIVDARSVWTGSTNITENCLYRNDNNSVRVTSQKLAADYEAEFEEMFQDRKFGKASPRNTPFPEILIGDTRVECYFAPEDGVQQKIVDEIDAAQKTIDFMAFTFTSSEIAKAMAGRVKEGVDVRGIFDARGAASDYSQDAYLAKQGAQVCVGRNHYTMHNKVIIIDGETVITGSYNFSKSAETRNDENVLIIHSPVIAEKYVQKFESLLAPGP